MSSFYERQRVSGNKTRKLLVYMYEDFIDVAFDVLLRSYSNFRFFGFSLFIFGNEVTSRH